MILELFFKFRDSATQEFLRELYGIMYLAFSGYEMVDQN